MAHNAEPHPPLEHESTMDYAQHERTYQGFVRGMKWAIGISAVTMIVLYFLVNP